MSSKRQNTRTGLQRSGKGQLQRTYCFDGLKPPQAVSSFRTVSQRPVPQLWRTAALCRKRKCRHGVNPRRRTRLTRGLAARSRVGRTEMRKRVTPPPFALRRMVPLPEQAQGGAKPPPASSPPLTFALTILADCCRSLRDAGPVSSAAGRPDNPVSPT
jgi:hypothetical protein